jgi:hypothetical protein
MRQTIKKLLWVVGLVFSLQSVWAFSLLGPVANGVPANGSLADTWQVEAIGFNPIPEFRGAPPYLGYDTLGIGPKNLGEGYRWNTPVIYYGFNQNFWDYFGVNGEQAVVQAFGILNNVFTNNPTGMTNGLDGYSSNLVEFPMQSQSQNYQATVLELRDLKSTTLAVMMEQLGLADAIRYMWVLHNRYPITGGRPCPLDMDYLVVMRNFDIVTSPLNQLQYSDYINGGLYTYYIPVDNCGQRPGPPDTAAVPQPADPLVQNYPVASGGEMAAGSLGRGFFYTGLTRDDVGGLRYLLSANNVNMESSTAGSVLISTTGGGGTGGFGPPFQLYTSNYTAFAQAVLTNNPAALLALYPGLVITSATTNYSFVNITNITPYYTNWPGPAVTNLAAATNLVTGDLGLLIQEASTNNPAALVALYPGLQVSTVTNFGVQVTTNVIFAYTNQPGPDVTNFLTLSLTTSDLGLLLQQAATNNPATLQALYPGLLFSTVSNQTVVVVTNIIAYYTNQPGPDVTNLGTIQLLNPPPNTVPPPITSGTIDFGLFTLQALTNTAPNSQTAIAQLQALYPGLEVLSATPYFTNVVTTNYITYLTNRIGAPAGSPPIQTNLISGIYTNYVERFSYVFGNLMLRSNATFYPFVDYNTSRSLYGTNETVTNQTISVTNLIGAPVGSPQSTNITTTMVQQYGVTGDFFILPTNWCGFTIVTPLDITKLISYTNTFTTIGTTNGFGAAQFTQNTIHTYTNRQFEIEPGICQPVLQFATNYTTNVVVTYQNTLLNVYTNSYSLTNLQTVITTNIFTTNGAPVGTLYTNVTVTNIAVSVPTGDFFIIPTNWCGFQIVSNLLTSVAHSTNTTLTAGPVPIFSAPGVVSGLTLLYSQTVITSFTNHTLLIHEGVCEPVLTNYVTYTTNVVQTYSNTLLNVITNPANPPGTYFTNSFVTLITTNIFTTNGAPVGTLITNGTQVSMFTNIPTGDFFIVPTNWCGYQYQVLSTNLVTSTNMVTAGPTPIFSAPGVVSGLTVSYSQTTISEYTNHTLVIQPGVCEPILLYATNVTSTSVTTYQDVFANVITNPADPPGTYFTNSVVILITTNIFTTNGAPVGTLITNVTSTNVTLTNGNYNTVWPSGDYYINTNYLCGPLTNISSLYTGYPLTNVVATTNVLVVVTNSAGYFYSQSLVTYSTDHVFIVESPICAVAPTNTTLTNSTVGEYEGIEKIQFVRVADNNIDPLTGGFFQPITNTYTMMVVLPNSSQATVQTFQRVLTQPDILFSAADLLPGPGVENDYTVPYWRVVNFNQSNILPGLAGPGTIDPSSTITFDKVGPVFENISPNFLTEANAFLDNYFIWGSFDGSTNDPTVYPNGTSIATLESEALIQISPLTLPDGTNAWLYSVVTLSVTGGQPPYTWMLATNSPALPTGLGLSGGVISGTPTNNPAGLYDFTVQMNDSSARSVRMNYSITIH